MKITGKHNKFLFLAIATNFLTCNYCVVSFTGGTDNHLLLLDLRPRVRTSVCHSLQAGPHYLCHRTNVSLLVGRFETSHEEDRMGSG